MGKPANKLSGNTVSPSRRGRTIDRCQSHFSSSDSVVSESDVSIQFLKDLLGTLKVEAIVDEDGELEVGEAFGPVVFIRIEPNRHWIVFNTGFSTPVLDDEQRREFADYLNNNLNMAQFIATNSGIGMSYFLYYRGGLNVDQFIAIAQRFGSLAFTAVKHLTTFSARPETNKGELGATGVLN